MTYVAKITIDHTKVPSNLTDFPIYINLADMPASFWSTVANGGGDIRVYKSDGTTQLAREVVSCINGGTNTGELHVKFSGTLSSSVDTEIQIHADGSSSEPAAGSTYGSQAVWSDYFAVYHLKEASGNAVDSTANARTLTDNGSVGSGAGKIGNARTFNGSSQYMATGSAGIDLNSAFTIQGFIKTPSVTTQMKSFWVGESDSNGSIEIETDAGGGNIRCTVWNGGSSNITATSAISNNTFYLLHASKTGTTLTFYKDASSVGTASASGWSGSAGSNLYAIGRHANAAANYWNGVLDEFRLRQSALSADWITAEKNNQVNTSTFYVAIAPSTTYNQSMPATVTATAKVMKGMSKTLASNVTATAKVLKGLSKTLASSVTATARVIKQMSKTLASTVTATAVLTAIRVYLITLASTVTATAAITKVPGKILASTVTATANIAKQIQASRTLAATVTATAAMLKGMSKTLASTVEATASITKTPSKILASTVTATASVMKQTGKLLAATVTATAVMQAGRAVIMAVTVTATASMGKQVGKLLAVTVTALAKVKAPFWKTKYPSHGDSEEYNKKYND